MLRPLLSVTVATVLASALPASAQGEAPPPAPPASAPLVAPPAAPSDYKAFSITWSPIHLALPLIELTAEYVIAPKFSIAVIGGAGRVSDPDNTITASAYEVGGQVNYYVMKPATGLHVGVEAIYVHVGDIEQDASLTAEGLAVGPFAGWKVITQIGFTFVAQLGVQYAAVQAESSTQMAERSKFIPLLNLNIGWSF